MRTPSEYLSAAVANVRARLMPDCVSRLDCCGGSAEVTRAAATTREDGQLDGDSPAEAVRVLALAADFPAITAGEVALLDSTARIVTSVRVDCAGATSYVGLSRPLAEHKADWRGTRGTRGIHTPVKLLAEFNGRAADIADGYAPTAVDSWTLCVPFDAWPEVESPQTGDEVLFEHLGATVRLHVASVDRRSRHWVVRARSR